MDTPSVFPTTELLSALTAAFRRRYSSASGASTMNLTWNPLRAGPPGTIPYTFFSGFELKPDDEPEAEETTVLEGGIEADVIEAAKEETAETEEAVQEAADEVQEAAEAPAEDVKAEDKTEETAE